MSSVLERTLNVVLTVAVAVCAIVLVRRELQPEAAAAPSVGPPEYVKEWRELFPIAATFGAADAPIQLVVFTDFECPFCRRFHESVLQSMRSTLSDSVGLRVVHFPLPMHRFARPAALAFECGLRQSDSERLLDALYAKQDSFGLKSWVSYAVDAGVSDTLSFQACLRSEKPTRIDAGFAMSQRLGIRGTPGVMVNGYLFPTPPTDSQLVSIARLLLAGGGVLPDVRPARQVR